MKEDIIQYVRTCKTCQKRKRRHGEAPLEPIQKTPQPFYQIGIDIMGPLPVTRTGKRYIVVAIDHFTKWVSARALETADAQSIADFLITDIIYCHGVPTIMTSDQGTEFVNELIQAVSDVQGFHHIKTTTYHPQGNGQTEHANRYIKDVLATTKKGEDWSINLSSAIYILHMT